MNSKHLLQLPTEKKNAHVSKIYI